MLGWNSGEQTLPNHLDCPTHPVTLRSDATPTAPSADYPLPTTDWTLLTVCPHASPWLVAYSWLPVRNRPTDPRAHLAVLPTVPGCPNSTLAPRCYTAGENLGHQRQHPAVTSFIKVCKLDVWMRPTPGTPKKKK
jgi:hypothetical protein